MYVNGSIQRYGPQTLSSLFPLKRQITLWSSVFFFNAETEKEFRLPPPPMFPPESISPGTKAESR